MVFNGGSSTLNVDSRYLTAGGVGGNGNSTTHGVFGLGLSELWFGWIGELIIYDAVALTGSQVQRTEQYLARKWGLA